MNSDTSIERMAREAGMFSDGGWWFSTDGDADVSTAALARFAALIRADERERCAKVCADYAVRHGDKGDVHSKAQGWMMLQCAAAIRG